MPVSLAPLVSRRRFLTQAAAAACFGLGSRFAGAEVTPDGSVWALLSDTHIDAAPETVAREVTMAANLKACVAEVLARRPGMAGVVVSGDCAYLKGLQSDYETFSTLVRPLREARLPLHLLMGNHDDRAAFSAVLSRAAALPPPVEDRRLAVQEAPLANWFLLDSLDKVNSTPGLLGAAQLAWLARELDARPEKPAMIVVHHNVVTEPAKTALQDSPALLELLRPRRHVKAIFYGHTHRWELLQDTSGLHLVNLPPTAYVFKPGLPNGWVQATLRPGGIALELRCLDAAHPQQGEVKELVWRA